MANAALVACVANVFISILSTCLYYKLIWSLQPFRAFAVQLGALMQVFLCGVFICVLTWMGGTQQQSVHFIYWVELAFWLSLQDTLEIAAIDGLGSSNGDLAPVLQQAVVPLTLCLSMLVFGKRYSALHWAAALVVAGGITASYVPAANFDEPSSWAALFVASRVPQVCANVRCEWILRPPPSVRAVREKSCRGEAECGDRASEGRASEENVGEGHAGAERTDEGRTCEERIGNRRAGNRQAGDEQACAVHADEHRASSCVAGCVACCSSVFPIKALRSVVRAGFWTALLGLPINAFMSLLLNYCLARDAHILWEDYAGGARCLLGLNTSVAAASAASATSAGAHCDGRAGRAALAFLVPGVLFAVSEFHVVQTASAATYFVLMGVELPLQTAALSAPALMGVELASTWHHSLLWGMPCVALGLGGWALAERRAHCRQTRPLGTRGTDAHGLPTSRSMAHGVDDAESHIEDHTREHREALRATLSATRPMHQLKEVSLPVDAAHVDRPAQNGSTLRQPLISTVLSDTCKSSNENA